MPVSYSKHTLSADNGLNIPNKINWLYLKFINNFSPNKYNDPELEVDTFRTDSFSFRYEGFPETVSPARYLCNLFWKEFLHYYSTELGDTIKALEIGCGSGIYEYTGLDIIQNEILRVIWADMSSSSDEACFYALALKHPSSQINSGQA